MAERALVAFGRYLRMLRDRKGLSLEEAVTLTRVYPSPLSKGYLSRLENGATRAGFEKIVALAKAYGVPVDVLAERLWLDLELEKNDPPETEGMTFKRLTASGSDRAHAGWRWKSYAYLRDATALASSAPVNPGYRDQSEQVAIAIQNCATAATKLGALNFALWEYKYVESLGTVSTKNQVSLLSCISTLHRRRGELQTARLIADRAIEAGRRPEGATFLGYAYSTRAVIAHLEGEFSACLEIQKLALAAFRAAGREAESASAHHAIGQMFFELGRTGAGRRAMAAAERIASKLDLHDVRVRIRLSLGEFDFREQKFESAIGYWQDAARLARESRDRTLLFMAEHRLMKQAIAEGRRNYAQSLARHLQRLT
ncbi:MAG TPA: helix-turn-helix transcriptional regulator, partial [Candidatus Polarisedimenticolaceae bacterium]